MSPVLSQLFADNDVEARSVEQAKVFEAAVRFAQIEGILAAPEPSHAIWTAFQEAIAAKETGKPTTILFGLTGTGYFDMKAYAEFNDKTMADIIPTDEDIARNLEDLPKLPQ
jgi:tryptophan synthase beta chain